MTKRQMAWVAAGCFIFCSAAAAADRSLELTIGPAAQDRVQAPVRARIEVPPELAGCRTIELKDAAGKTYGGQLTAPALLDPEADSGKNARVLWLIAPELKAGQPLTLSGTLSTDAPAHDTDRTFSWHETPGEPIDLRSGGRPALRYMRQPLDETTPASREQTYKVYHHLFDPTGQTLLTKGPGGQYTHHRGLFYGFNKISYGDGQTADTWHCTGDAHLSHEKVVAAEAGPVLGRHRLLIDWHGPGKEVFAHEERELTLYHVAGGQLVEFASRLRTAAGPVKLDGDPQHAGFQFRAANEVAESTKAETYYLRPDGPGKPGETRNWPDQKEHVNLPWNGMSFVVGGQRYTAIYLDRPQNPKEARFSERDYGRFGSYFVHELTAEHPLEINYRVWLQPGEMTVPAAAAQSVNFVEAVPAKVEWK